MGYSYGYGYGHTWKIRKKRGAAAAPAPMTVMLTAPLEGAALSGTVTLTAVGSGGTPPYYGVQFLRDGTSGTGEGGVDLGVDITPPYSITWDSNTAANGPHLLQTALFSGDFSAFAFDEISVTVANAALGGGILLESETNGWATDFLYATDANRVALKAAGVITYYAVNSFYQNAGTSPKMVYDVSGVLGWSPHNYVRMSETFDNATNWVAENCTIAVNAIAAPDGTLTADKLVENSANGSHDLQQGGIPSITGQMSVYAKAAGRTRILIYDATSGTGYGFDLTTGTTFAVSGIPPGSATIQDAGNGWWRCSLACVGATTIGVYTCNGTIYSYAGDGVSGVYLWGAQVNKGSVPTAYLPTTTTARVGLALDYDPVTHAARGLLCEPQATNLCLQSAAGRTGFAWSGNGSTYTPAQPDPSGGNEALLVVTNANLGINVGQQVNIGVTAGQVYTGSCWCKGTAGQQIYFYPDSAIASSQVVVTFTGRWQRVSKSFTAVATNAYLTLERYDRIGSAHLPDVTFTIWGGQFEAGTVATSYIPTLAATVTRAADQVSVTPASINYSATAGSWWVETYLMGGAGDEWIIGSSTAASPMLYNLGGVTIRDGTQIYIPPGPAITNNINKLMSAFTTGSRAITYNGQAPVTDTGTVTNLLSQSYVGFGSSTGGSGNALGYIRRVRYVPRRPTNAEMQTQTTTLPYTGTIASQVMVTAAAASTGASASFTPPANSTLVAFVSARGGTSATATTLVDSLGSVWTKIGDYQGPQSTAFIITGIYKLAIGAAPAARTVTASATVTGVSMGSGCQVISCTGTIGGLNNTQVGTSTVGPLSLTVSGVSILSYYIRQTTASSIVVPTGYTELGGGAHIQYNNMTASVAYDLTSPGNQNWNGGGNAMAWAVEITG